MKKPDASLEINGKSIGEGKPVYYIADIAANHDGDLDRAKDLIKAAADAGADAAKFQHFSAATIVSDFGFRGLNRGMSHQANWRKSVFDTYQDASVNLDWTQALRETCDKAGIAFFTSPYSLELVDHIDQFVPAFKVGSGDITWLEIIRHIASKQKPFLLASGASTLSEVERAVGAALEINPRLCLMQCNTNYTASVENFKYIQLNVLKTYRQLYPGLVLGLSDHTPGHSTVLGAIALGARMIEKHFTDDTTRSGPDHAFSMSPRDWREMVDRSRELENALGDGVKVVEANEQDTVIVQRRAVRATRSIQADTILAKTDLEVLRPCPPGAISPADIDRAVGRRTSRDLQAGEHLEWTDLK